MHCWAGYRHMGAFKAFRAPTGPLPRCWGLGQIDAHHLQVPGHPIQEVLQRGWASSPAPCTYLLSARSVLLPTSMMITSLPSLS